MINPEKLDRSATLHQDIRMQEHDEIGFAKGLRRRS